MDACLISRQLQNSLEVILSAGPRHQSAFIQRNIGFFSAAALWLTHFICVKSNYCNLEAVGWSGAVQRSKK